MPDLTQIHPHAEVIGADGVHVGTVDKVVGDRIQLTREDSPDGVHHFIDASMVLSVEQDVVRLTAAAAVAPLFEETDPENLSDEERLEEGLKETFPASDPVSAKHIT